MAHSRCPEITRGREGGSFSKRQSWHHDDVIGARGLPLGDHVKQGKVGIRA